MEIVGETCSMVADPSTVPPTAMGGSVSMKSALEGAVRPVGAAPGGLIVLTIAPVAAEIEIEIESESGGGGVAVPAVTVRTPLMKEIV